MSWITVIWSVVAGMCLTMAVVYLLVWLRDRDSWTNLAFALCSIAAAVTAVFELAMMHSQTPVQYGQILRWMHVPIFLLAASYVWFVRSYLQAGRAWLLWSFLAARALILVVDLASVPNISFQEITSLRFVSIAGDTFAVPAGIMSPRAYLIRLSEVLLLLFIGNASYAAWKKGKRSRALITGALFFVAAGIAVTLSVMMVQGTLLVPMTQSMPFLLIVPVMGYDMNFHLVRIHTLSRDLKVNQERIRLATTATNLGIWGWDIDRDIFWLNETSRARLGVGESERLTFDRFLEKVHQGDREQIQQAIPRILEGEDDFEGIIRFSSLHNRFCMFFQKATPAFLSVMTAGGINTNDLFFEYLDLQRHNNPGYRQRLAALRFSAGVCKNKRKQTVAQNNKTEV